MNSQDWEKIQKNSKDLTSQRNAKDLSRYLESKSVIDVDDVDRITGAGTPKDCMEALLETLRTAPSSKDAYSHLLEALRQTKTEWLADKIDATPTQTDRSSTEKCDPKWAKEKARKVLNTYFCMDRGYSTPVADVEKILRENEVFEGVDPWTQEETIVFVSSIFNVTKEKKSVRKKMHNKTVLYFKNLRKLDRSPNTRGEDCSSATSILSGACSSQNLSDMSAHQLKEYLTDKLQKDGMKIVSLDDLEANDICGSVFLSLNEGDLEKVLPLASFGIRRKLSMIIQSCSKTTPEPTEGRVYLRKFDTQVDHIVKYHKGRCCDVSSFVTDKTTQPLRVFNLLDSTESNKDTLEFIGSSVVQFASACINERRNGTVYYGISPDASPGFKKGEVIGTNLPRESIEDMIRKYCEKSFDSAHAPLIKNIVRDAKFVPVLVAVTTGESEWVVEVDVVPSEKILENDKIITLHKLKGFPQSPKEGMYGFSSGGLPKLLSLKEMQEHEKFHCRIVSQRKKDEAEKNSVKNTTDFRQHLLNLLAGGYPVMQDDVFPFFMLSPVDNHMDQDYISKHMSFVKGLRPELVLDFDPKGSSHGVYANLHEKQEDSVQILVPDNFDKQKSDKNDIESLKKSLADLTRTAWMFCNGYPELDIAPVTRIEWKKYKKEGFMNALQFFIDSFESERIILIVCLFSDNYDIMLDACDEALTKVQNGWILLAESEEIACRWKESMLDRCTVEKEDLSERCVVGMSWLEVNSTLLQAAQVADPQTYLLPTSKGARVDVRGRKLEDWCDLDIVTAGDIDPEKSNFNRKEVEEKFYRGDQANWSNYWFDGQVLKRDIHSPLMERVREALKGNNMDEENMVTVVPILHQPMAGGTTSARQVLWELRSKYRCCVVLAITENTIDQLDEVRAYKDTDPLPLLILVDNEDEDKYVQLKGNLEARGRRMWRESYQESLCHVYCTIILCIRSSSLPKETKKDQTILRQELTPRELEWFRKKGEELAQVYKKDKSSSIDPRFLISFNILKENFNRDYITRVVKEFTDDIKKDREIELLKFVSFLNTFDPYFKSLRVSALDILIKKTSRAIEGESSHKGQRQLSWEAQLSQSVKVLLNLSTNRERHRKPRTMIRVMNKIIAEQILTNMKVRSDQTDSEIMRQILRSGVFDHFAKDMEDMKGMRILINNIVKKREIQPDGLKKYRFSRFVLKVQETEGAEAAVGILEHVFEENEDAFTAQLISRYYISLKNWQKAKKFAKIATELFPLNSYLLDTYGQVFKEQLQEMTSQEDFQIDVHTYISLSRECTQVFKKVQKVSEREITANGEINLAGYFNELRATEQLLEAITSIPCFADPVDLQRFLVCNESKYDLKQYFSEAEIEYVIEQIHSSTQAMRKLDDEFLQVKDSSNYDVSLPVRDNNRSDLINIKVKLDKYLAPPNTNVPTNMPKEMQCKYRDALIKTHGGNSLNNLLILRSKDNYQEIRVIYFWAFENMKQLSPSFDNFRTALDAATVLLAFEEVPFPKSLTFNALLDWSKQLYTKPQVEGYRYLEPYLYFTMYNFPTKERQRYNLCPTVDLKRAMEKWYDAFNQKYHKNDREDLAYRRKSKTMFFLAKGKPLRDIVHQDSLDEMKGASRQDKWQIEGVRQKLRLMDGVLLPRGEKIKCSFKNAEGNSFQVDIVTSYVVKKKEMWQKKVYFYLGFSFAGPKAFGISLDPGMANC